MILYVLLDILLISRLNKSKSSRRLLLVIEVLSMLSIEMCSQLGKLGDIFMSTVSDSDPEHTRKIASAYDHIVKSCSGEPLEVVVTLT